MGGTVGGVFADEGGVGHLGPAAEGAGVAVDDQQWSRVVGGGVGGAGDEAVRELLDNDRDGAGAAGEVGVGAAPRPARSTPQGRTV